MSALVVVRTGSEAQIPPLPAAERQSDALRQHLRDARAAAAADPSSPAAVGAYCVALHADMFYDAAESCYGVAAALEPANWEWTYYRALLRSDLGDTTDLAARLRVVLAAAPGFAPAWLRLGDAEFKARRYAEAEQAWTRVRELPEPERPRTDVERRVEIPASSYAALGIARIRLLRGDAAGALQLLDAVLAAGPPFGSAYRLRAEILSASGREDDAARALARARRLPPFAPYADPFVDRLALASRNSTFLLRLASEADLGINGRWSEYLTRRALQFDPDNPEVVVKLGRVLRTLGQNEEALQHFRRYEAMVPGDPQSLAHIGSCLSALGRFAEAEPYLRRAAASLDDALSHYNLGLLLATTGRLDEAVAEYAVALERDPNDTTARGNLAAALVRRGDLARAAQELTRVLALDPEDPIAHTNLGLVHMERGDIPRARRAFAEALRLNPGFPPAADALREIGGP